MQRGTTRPRSESEEEDTTAIPTAPDALLSSDSRPRQRRRVDSSSPVLASAAHTPVISITPISDIPSIDRIQQDSPSQLRIPTPVSTMGPPHLHGDIVAPHEAAEAGPSSSPSRTNGTNGHATSPTHSHVRLVKPAGSLMYEDDKDWVEDPNKDDNIAPDDDTELIANARPALRPNGGRRMPVDREEVVRLILQGLRDIGYNQSAEVLEAESGFQLSSGSASDFEAAVLGGRWSEALGLLPQLGIDTSTPPTPSESIPNEDPPASSSASLKSVAMNSTHTVPSTKPMSPAQEMRFLISQQKYLEYLEVGQQKKALSTLRSELAPVAKDPEVLHNLSGFMMCLDKDDLYERSSWDGAARTSRRKLLEQLQTHISPKVMVPQRRLATLLEQARQYQALSCPYHQGSEPSSLYTNHQCDAGQFPSITTHILADHTDEVWRIEWSPDGLMLASAGKDRLVVIWGLELENGTWTVRPLHHLREHREPVDVMAWSPNGKTLVTGADKSLYLWDTQTGEQKRIAAGASPHVDQISAIQWRPDGTEFTVSSMDCKLVTYSATGAMLRQWASTPFQIRDFAFSPDTTKIIAVTATLKRVTEGSKLKPSVSSRGAEPTTLSNGAGHSDEWSGFAYVPMEHGVMMIRLVDREILDYHILDGAKDRNKDIASMKLSWDASKVLLSINPDEIQLWAVEPRIKPLRQYAGHMHQQYLIRSAFGATKDRFVLSGSEDGHVYVWQANSPHPIQVLAGHDKVVNSVAWNPVTSRRIFASCSDDHTIRLWQAPSSPGESGQEAGIAESEK